jgi:hypothetical protein
MLAAGAGHWLTVKKDCRGSNVEVEHCEGVLIWRNTSGGSAVMSQLRKATVDDCATFLNTLQRSTLNARSLRLSGSSS